MSRLSGVEKVDLFFMIDNSISMVDKQAMLSAAVPKLVERLVTPRCVDVATKLPTIGNHPNCAPGSQAEFPPLRDIHIGVITSSLGAHGGETCAEGSSGFKAPMNDRGRLLPSVRPSLPNHEGLDFLWWNPKDDAADATDASTLIGEFTSQVAGAGESGCGYEASLEAWYRFLVDPQPPTKVERVGNFSAAERCEGEGTDCGAGGICIGGFCSDKTVLAQRQAFLRPDSLLAVIMLTDENDCSIRDDGQGWLVSQQANGLPRSTSACQQNPNDSCCTSCLAPAGPGCPAHDQDPECQKTNGVYTAPEDHVNLRCFQQKQRFGVDFLYPLSRYVAALKDPSIPDRSGNPSPNPLFSTGGGVSRDPSLIFLAGIVGVPWQSIATEDSQALTAALKYQHARDIDWRQITRTAGAPPLDPHMQESVLPRPGLASFSAGAGSDPIHGHDWDIPAAFASLGPGDLQFACTFPLAETKPCAPGQPGCDCNSAGVNGKSPLCFDGTQYTNEQLRAKAYPGLRQLELLRDFGDNAIVASICPKEAIDTTSPSFGYSPAVEALVDRFKEVINGACITRPIEIRKNPDGTTTTQCAIVEATPAKGDACNCDANANRRAPNSKLIDPVLRGLSKESVCGAAGQPSCTQQDFCLCEIGEAAPKTSCENDATPQGIGWCYVDPSQGVGNDAVIPPQCEPRRQLRFVGPATPAPTSVVFIACQGKALGS
jgi:hypothetical protein